MLRSLEHLAQHHYENFPVASRFIPKEYRRPIHMIYAFARVADDLADEGTLSPNERLAMIDGWEHSLEDGLNGKSDDKFFQELAQVVQNYTLSPGLLKDLLTAFRRDANNPVYERFDEVLEDCRYSANPIGRLLLQLFGCSNDRTVRLSDDICTALQLTNFWQDISVDTGRNRFYIPLLEMQECGLKKEDLLSGDNREAFTAWMKKQVAGTRELFRQGKPLPDLVTKEFRFELKLIWHGGMRILEKIEEQGFDTRKLRPSLNSLDKVKIFLRAALS